MYIGYDNSSAVTESMEFRDITALPELFYPMEVEYVFI